MKNIIGFVTHFTESTDEHHKSFNHLAIKCSLNDVEAKGWQRLDIHDCEPFEGLLFSLPEEYCLLIIFKYAEVFSTSWILFFVNTRIFLLLQHLY